MAKLTFQTLAVFGRLCACYCVFTLMASSVSAAEHGELDPFDCRSLNGWMMNDGKPVTKGWECVDGMIHLKPADRRVGDILTRREFNDFRLSFEWRIAPGGNSGLKYRVRSYSLIGSAKKRVRGLEYQILDDVGYRIQPVLGNVSTGSLYALYPPNEAKRLLPVGEFNQSTIVVQNNHVEHWLNGQRIISATIGSRDWLRRVKNSKFNDVKDFGLNPTGRIMLTDHGGEVWYRHFVFHSLSTNDAPERVPPTAEKAADATHLGDAARHATP